MSENKNPKIKSPEKNVVEKNPLKASFPPLKGRFKIFPLKDPLKSGPRPETIFKSGDEITFKSEDVEQMVRRIMDNNKQLLEELGKR